MTSSSLAQPAADIGGVVFASFERQPEISAEERSAQLGHEFFAGIAFVTEKLAAEVAVEAALVPRPMSAFMRKGARSSLLV
ncbi:hypothetical protein A3722_22840 [Sulfitobacter sp. HI0027]|uniref:hypothetical protein n=1 Tax=Sulfitobacter sp. HI0027 TaxID=1822226 RepID=UPI0007C2F360|nr:hypothetical protein A3722_22840 [Sulfitobacter sp. HI0027]